MDRFTCVHPQRLYLHTFVLLIKYLLLIVCEEGIYYCWDFKWDYSSEKKASLILSESTTRKDMLSTQYSLIASL